MYNDVWPEDLKGRLLRGFETGHERGQGEGMRYDGAIRQMEARALIPLGVHKGRIKMRGLVPLEFSYSDDV